MPRPGKVPLTTLPPMVQSLDMAVAKPMPKETDAELGTWAHKVWSRAVIKRAGNRCEDPLHVEGSAPSRRLYADHITERKDGGDPLDLANGMCRCASCHTRKTIAERDRRMAR